MCIRSYNMQLFLVIFHNADQFMQILVSLNEVAP